MKAISIKQPWASLIVHGIKDVENRTWKLPEKYKGKRVLIHASSKPDKEPYMLLNDEQINIVGDRIMDVVASYHTFSAIIGSVVFTDFAINHPSVWAEKSEPEYLTTEKGRELGIKPTYNWVVSDAVLFDEPIFHVRGSLNFWEFDPEICRFPLDELLKRNGI